MLSLQGLRALSISRRYACVLVALEATYAVNMYFLSNF